MLFGVDYRLPPELKVILEQRKNHKDYVRHPNLRSNFPLEFCFSQWMLSGKGGPGFPVVPDGRQFPGCCLVSCSQSSPLQMRGELANTWGLSEMLNDAADCGIVQSASSCMYPGPNVLYLCLCPHSKLLSTTIIWTSGRNTSSFLLMHVQ